MTIKFRHTVEFFFLYLYTIYIFYYQSRLSRTCGTQLPKAQRLAGSIDWERYKCDVKESVPRRNDKKHLTTFIKKMNYRLIADKV